MPTGTTRKCLWIAMAMGFVAAPCRGQGEGKTLREVLAAENLPVETAKLANLEKKISSGAELNDGGQFVIAYYVLDADGMLNPPIFLDVYDRAAHQWKSAELEEAKTQSEGIDADCLGSILSVTALGKRLLLETHINPSAGCLLVVSPRLELEASLYGWFLGRLGEDEVIYHRSEIHFAPVHPAEIALYDLKTKRDVTIFPHKPEQAVRRARAEELKKFYDAHEGWCAKWNDPCDPEQFDSEIEGQIKTNEAEGALAFVVSYEQAQLHPDDAEKPSGPKDVVYVYRRVHDEARMEYREMRWSEVRELVGSVPIEKLVEPAALEKIFSREAK